MIMTRFAVWPEEGGILNQDPLFLRRLRTYTTVKSRYEERKAAAEKSKANNKKPRGR